VDKRQEQADFIRADVKDISFFSAASFFDFYQIHRFVSVSHPPNKSPEPTAVGACRSAAAVHVASRRWLSFFR
jgi:hypothetical protein